MQNGKYLERLTFFLMGSAVAAGIAFMVSPRSGRENRELLAMKAREGREFLGGQLRRGQNLVRRGKEQAVEQAQDLVARAKGVAQQQVESLGSKVEEMKGQVG